MQFPCHALAELCSESPCPRYAVTSSLRHCASAPCYASPLPCLAYLSFAVALFFFAMPSLRQSMLCLCAAWLCLAFAMFSASPLCRCSVILCEAVLCPRYALRCRAFPLQRRLSSRSLAHLQSALSAVQRVANAAFLHGTDSNRPRSAVRHALAYPASAVSKIAAVKHTVAVSAVAATPSVPLSLSPAVVSSPNHAAVAAVSKSRFISCSSVFTRTTLERSERVILFFLCYFLSYASVC